MVGYSWTDVGAGAVYKTPALMVADLIAGDAADKWMFFPMAIEGTDGRIVMIALHGEK